MDDTAVADWVSILVVVLFILSSAAIITAAVVEAVTGIWLFHPVAAALPTRTSHR